MKRTDGQMDGPHRKLKRIIAAQNLTPPKKQDNIELLSKKKDGELTPSPESMPNEKKETGSTDSQPNHRSLSKCTDPGSDTSIASRWNDFLLRKVVLTDTHKFLRGICLTKTQLDHIQSFLVFLQYLLLHFLPYKGMKKQDIFYFCLSSRV